MVSIKVGTNNPKSDRDYYDHALVLLSAVALKMEERFVLDAKSGIIGDKVEKVLHRQACDFLNHERVMRDLKEAMEKWEAANGK